MPMLGVHKFVNRTYFATLRYAVATPLLRKTPLHKKGLFTKALHVLNSILMNVRQCRTINAMIFIETSTFSKLLSNYLTDDEYRGLQAYLLQKPEAGSIVRGSGGVRKVRWSASNKGKSGGIRAIYYWKKSEREIWMLTLYSKSERATIAGHTLKQIAEAINNE
jgi:hypothetical protein